MSGTPDEAARSDPGLSAAVPFTWACHRSGRCCTAGHGYVWLEQGEAEAMAADLELDPGVFRERFTLEALDPSTGELRTSLREASAHGGGRGGRCVLLEGVNGCSVYDARPGQCRSFPYWKAALRDPHAFERVRSVCPGVAVVLDAAQRKAGFAAVEGFLAELPPPVSGCTFAEHDAGEVWATGLEVDYALAHAEPRPHWVEGGERGAAGCPFREGVGCRAGGARPTVCRPTTADASAAARLRAIVEDTGYPPGYGPLADMVRSREVSAPEPS